MSDMKAGDRIKIKTYTFGHETGEVVLTVEEFRQSLGVFRSHQARQAGHFTPLCDLYKPVPGSQEKYIPNYGLYCPEMQPAWEVVAPEQDWEDRF